MGNAVFQFEVKSWLRAPLFYLLALSFFLFPWVSMLGSGGYFDGPAQSTEGVKLLNSPYALGVVSFVFVKLLLFATAIFGGFSLYRDFSNKTHAFLYSYPITKAYYLRGKLSSVLLLLSLISAGAFLGIFLGALMLGPDNPKIGAYNPLSCAVVWGIYLLPTLLIAGIFVFGAVGASRNVFSGFIVVICFVLFQVLLENIVFDRKVILAILDPFGQHAFYAATQNWGFERQNSTTLPVDFVVLLNRAIWLSLALLFYFSFARKFDLQYDTMWAYKRRPAKGKATEKTSIGRPASDTGARLDFSLKARTKAFLLLMGYDFGSIVKNWMFWAISIFGGLAVFFIQLRVSNTGTFTLLPMTRLFIGAPLSIYTLIIILSTFLFSGALVNRSRQYKMSLMVAATPIAGWQLLFSKIGAVSLVQMLQLFLFLIVSLAIQITNGYYRVEFSLYAFHLFVLVLPVLLVWNLTSHFVHTLFPNLFLGLFVLLGVWLGAQSLEQIGISTHLLQYNTLPALEYTDFAGYGDQLKGYFLLVAYWLALGCLLLLGTMAIGHSGNQWSFFERMALARSKMSPLALSLMMLLGIVFSCFALKIYQAENADSVGKMSASSRDKLLKVYKKSWAPFSGIVQPKITDADLRIDIYPGERRFLASGKYQLVNQSDKIIDTVFIRTGFDEVTELDWNGAAQLLKKDTLFKSYLYKLSSPLWPGESLEFAFSIRSKANEMFSRHSNVLSDGTYLKQDILPRLGYQFVQHEAPVTDSLVNNYNYYHRDADYVDIHTIISTSKNQTAIAPGALVGQWTAGDRAVFEYRAPVPVKFNFSFHSAGYEVLEERHAGLSIQVHHKEGHFHNAELMIEGLKASLDFNTKLFGPYPYRQIRVVEFPHTEESHSATLTANNIPASEVLFGVNAEHRAQEFNLPFYIMAHELTHEWFGNQLIPADAAGAKMLTESITEYLTLCIYREYFGDELADRFLSIQKKRYKRGQKREREEEPPLSRVLAHQEYLAYGKGAMAFDAIAQGIGRDKLNFILQRFLNKYKYPSNYYPTTSDFIQFLKKNTHETDHHLIDHWLTQVNDIH